MQPLRSSFGPLLRRYRLAAALTQEALAERAGLSTETISALERGKSKTPRFETVVLLADALGLDGDDRRTFQEASVALVPDVAVTTAEESGVRGPHPAITTTRLFPPRRSVRQPSIIGRALISISLTTVVVLSGLLALHLRGGHNAGILRARPTRLRFQAAWAFPTLQPFTLEEPRGVAIGPDGNLFIADYARATILEVTPRGGLLAQWGGPGPAAGEFIQPTDLAVDGRGNVYIADTRNSRIQELSRRGQPLRVWNHQSMLEEPLTQPEGVAVDRTGDLYIADTGNNRLLKLKPDGSLAWTFPSRARAVAVSLSGEVAVLDVSNALQSTPKIVLLSPSGTVEGVLRPEAESGSHRPTFGNFRQWHITFTGSGTILASDGTSDNIWMFGVKPRSMGVFQSHIRSPAGMAVAPGGNEYIAQVATGEVIQVSARGRVLSRWHTLLPATEPLHSPSGIAADAAGHVYVSDTGNNRVVELSSTGTLLGVWRGTSGDGQVLRHPVGVAIGRQGLVYVVDRQHNVVDALLPHGGRIFLWLGRLRSPEAIAVDYARRVYVADSTSVHVFSSSRRQVDSFAARVSSLAVDGHGSLYLAAGLPSLTKVRPEGTTMDVIPVDDGPINAVAVGPTGMLYAIDSSAGRLYVINSRGTVIQMLGGRGRQVGQLWSPRALAVGADGRVYVADTGNNRVDVFAPSR